MPSMSYKRRTLYGRKGLVRALATMDVLCDVCTARPCGGKLFRSVWFGFFFYFFKALLWLDELLTFCLRRVVVCLNFFVCE